jgi:CHAT domain-containing protein
VGELAVNASTAALRRDVASAELATRGLLSAQEPTLWRSDESLPTPGEIAAALPDSTALIEFFVAREHFYAIILQKNRMEAVKLGHTSPVQRACRLLDFQLRPLPEVFDERATERVNTYLRELHDLLWRDIDERVLASHLLLIPHAFLHQVPLHALFDGHTYVVDRYTITYSPSASVAHIASSRRRVAQDSGSLIIGTPDASAPEIAAEIESIARLMPGARVLAGDAATKARVQAELPNARYIHIAAHGAFSIQEPKSSFLSLSDGTLTAEDLTGLQLGADLVVLSGCETGRSGLRGSDELIGLTQALLQAGARSTLVSLWRVDDRSTAVLMRRLYTRLRSNTTIKRAVHETILEHKEEYPHPFHWAPFVLVGDCVGKRPEEA